MSEHRCGDVMVPVNGMALDLTSDEKGFEETVRVSCERLREGGGGASKACTGSGVSTGLGWGNRGIGVELRDRELVHEWKELWTEELLDRDWLFNQEVEENRSEASGSKGSIFNCASLWIPFVPFI